MPLWLQRVGLWPRPKRDPKWPEFQIPAFSYGRHFGPVPAGLVTSSGPTETFLTVAYRSVAPIESFVAKSRLYGWC
jgi:hypothetical protein